MPQWVPRISRAGGGTGPSGSADHQTAKYIVGNALAGDTLDVCDFLDPGDCTGLALAIAAAGASFLDAGDIYLRPGVYDFGAPTAPPLPLELPVTLTLRGPKQTGVPPSFGIAPGAVLLVGANRHIMTTGQFGFTILVMENINVALLDVADPVGTHVIGDIDTFIVEMSECTLLLPGQLQDVNLEAIVRADSCELVDCAVVGEFGGALDVTVFDTHNLRSDNLVCNAPVNEVAAAYGGSVTNGMLDCVGGVRFAPPEGLNSYFVVNGVLFQLDGGGGVTLIRDIRGTITGNTFIGNPGSPSVGISTAGNNVAINGNMMDTLDIGVDILAAADRTLVVGNVITNSVTAAIQDASATTITGFNIT